MVRNLLSIQHRLNPLHVYCRFVDSGLSRRSSALLCKTYEMVIFVWVAWVLKTLVYLSRFIYRSTTIEGQRLKKK